MNEEDINIAIAEHLGFTNILIEDGAPYGFERGVIPDREDPSLALNSTWLPDYCNDLNAMHEAVKSLSGDDMQQMTHALRNVTRSHLSGYELWNATAPQRAEAFLRTIGKWKETNP